jgi:hypothetical protein
MFADWNSTILVVFWRTIPDKVLVGTTSETLFFSSSEFLLNEFPLFCGKVNADIATPSDLVDRVLIHQSLGPHISFFDVLAFKDPDDTDRSIQSGPL